MSMTNNRWLVGGVLPGWFFPPGLPDNPEVSLMGDPGNVDGFYRPIAAVGVGSVALTALLTLLPEGLGWIGLLVLLYWFVVACVAASEWSEYRHDTRGATGRELNHLTEGSDLQEELRDMLKFVYENQGQCLYRFQVRQFQRRIAENEDGKERDHFESRLE